jgi:hypothetical protein
MTGGFDSMRWVSKPDIGYVAVRLRQDGRWRKLHSSDKAEMRMAGPCDGQVRMHNCTAVRYRQTQSSVGCHPDLRPARWASVRVD